MVQETNDEGWVSYDDETAQPKGRPSSGGIFMRTVKREAPYRARIVTSAVLLYKHFQAFKIFSKYPISPATNQNEKYKDVAWDKGDYLPSKQFAMLVIDREDGKVKILEVGGAVWGSINDYAKLTGINPASKTEGPDFLIQAKPIVRKDGKDSTEYSCLADPKGAKPLTEEEISEVERFKDSLIKYTKEKYNSELGWKWYYKPMDPDAMRQLWMSLPEDRRIRKRKDKGAPSQAPKTASEQPKQPVAPPPAKKQPAPAQNSEPEFMPDDEAPSHEPEDINESGPVDEPFF